MSTKFGLLINFDLLKAAISTNAKPEIVLLRFGRHVVLSRLPPRPLNTTGISGFAFLNIAAFRRSKSISKPNFGSEAPKAWESRRHRRRGGGDLSHEERLKRLNFSKWSKVCREFHGLPFTTLSKTVQQDNTTESWWRATAGVIDVFISSPSVP